ncbi:MAG: hypothetical protein LUQ38_05115 [Methanotrichaceae archaeon]|nr:hypothetical protein [Methanotrichaceae archaeon]
MREGRNLKGDLAPFLNAEVNKLERRESIMPFRKLLSVSASTIQFIKNWRTISAHIAAGIGSPRISGGPVCR